MPISKNKQCILTLEVIEIIQMVTKAYSMRILDGPNKVFSGCMQNSVALFLTILEFRGQVKALNQAVLTFKQ